MNGFDNIEREQLQNKSEIERLLTEMKESIIGFENYKKYFEKVKNTDQVILTQIENLVREYREYKIRFEEQYNKESHLQLVADGYVRLEVFEDSRMMNKIMLEAYSWKTLQEELYSIIFKKIAEILDDVNALEIKRDALKEFKEMDERKSELFLSTFRHMLDINKERVENKLEFYDEKFLYLIDSIDKDNRSERKQLMGFFEKIVSLFNDGQQEELKKDIAKLKRTQEEQETKKEMLEREFKKKETERKVEKEPVYEPDSLAGTLQSLKKIADKEERKGKMDDIVRNFSGNQEDKSILDD